MNEQARKIVHLSFGAAISAAILLLPAGQAEMILAAGLVAGLALAELVRAGYRVPLVSSLVDRLEREGEFPGKGAAYFVASALACTVFFPPAVAAAGVLSLSVLDAVSALAGRAFGRVRIWGAKTLEGSLAGIAANTAVLSLIIGPGTAFLVSVVAGTVELLAPVDDNLLVPPAACTCLSLLPP
ncbi:MAG: hypothetical protein QXL43_03515 [Methanolinea sp.]